MDSNGGLLNGFEATVAWNGRGKWEGFGAEGSERWEEGVDCRDNAVLEAAKPECMATDLDNEIAVEWSKGLKKHTFFLRRRTRKNDCGNATAEGF